MNHTDNLDSSKKSEVENSEKRKGNEHLQERDLSMKWIGRKWVLMVKMVSSGSSQNIQAKVKKNVEK